MKTRIINRVQRQQKAFELALWYLNWRFGIAELLA